MARIGLRPPSGSAGKGKAAMQSAGVKSSAGVQGKSVAQSSSLKGSKPAGPGKPKIGKVGSGVSFKSSSGKRK